MLHYIIAGIGLLLFMVWIVKCVPEPGSSTKLSFVPVDGASSGYFDCTAVANDGSKWKSVSGIWQSIGGGSGD